MKKNIFKRTLSIIIIVALFFSISLVGSAKTSSSDSDDITGICPIGNNPCSKTIRNEYGNCKDVIISTDSNFDFDMYTVIDAWTPVRKSPRKYSEIVGYLNEGDIIRNGNYICNEFGNSWLKYQTNDGDLYIFSDHLEKHEHDWILWCSGTHGHVEKCSACNTGRIVYDYPGYIKCNDNIICEVISGDWSNTSSVVSVIINTTFSYVPYVREATRTRDFIADLTHIWSGTNMEDFVTVTFALYSAVSQLEGGPASEAGFRLAKEYGIDVTENLLYNLLESFLDSSFEKNGLINEYCSTPVLNSN